MRHARRLYQERVWALALTAEPLARRLAVRFRRVGNSSVEDLQSAGLEGLFVAAERFDPGRGLRFSTVARWWARCHISRAAHDDRPVRLPKRWNELSMHLTALPEGLSVPELATAMGVPSEQVREVLFWRKAPFLFLDDTDADGEPHAIDDKAVSEDDWAQALDDARRLEAVLPLLEALPPRTQHIVRRYLGLEGEPVSLVVVGSEVGLSRERVRKLFHAAMATLQEGLHPLREAA